MSPQGNVAIRAAAYRTKGDSTSLISRVVSGQILPSGIYIQFEAVSSTGILYSSKDFEIKWQVVNTDHEAWEKKALRGDFYKSDTRGIRWETTEYRGIHWIEAFVIRKRDRVCTARSGRFFVVIE